MVWKPDYESLSRVGLVCPDSALADTDSSTNDDLMESIAHGNAFAFESLYNRFSGIVFSICMRKLKHELEANEVVSVVFFEVWQKADRFDRCRGTAAMFLFALTRSRIVDSARNRSRRAQLQGSRDPSIDLNNVESISLQPSDYAIAIEEGRELQNALDELTDVQRSLLEASFYSDLSHRQIAMLFKLPLGTVKSSIRQAIIGMRISLHRQDQQRDLVRWS